MMRLLANVRMQLARRPWVRWVFVAVLALGVGGSVASGLAGVRRERDAWGRSTTVYVATQDLVAGDPVGGALERREVPEAMVPDSALVALPAGSTATQRIGRGEIVTDGDIVDTTGPQALIPTGWLAIDVTDVANPTLFAVGDSAAVLAGGASVAVAAVIVEVTATDVVVAVPLADAPTVAAAANERTAVIALSAAAPEVP
ncbi:MAG: hypothetical protein JWN39_4394 [Ilumatobacteraceae bacterium]|nr:hypothetical protein [Ilumatobacteraceae bacterium]